MGTAIIHGPNTAPEHPSIPVGSSHNAKVSFKGQLDSGELLTGTPTVVEVNALDVAVSPSDLTISGKAVNTATIAVNEDTAVLAGQAVVYLVSGQLLTNTPYRIKITATTDGGQTLVGYDYLHVANN